MLRVILVRKLTELSLLKTSVLNFILQGTSSQVYGRVFAPNYSGNTSAVISAAAHDMNQAYLRAMLESPATYSEFAGGALAGQTLTPGM